MDADETHAYHKALRDSQVAIKDAYGKRLALILKGRDAGISNRSIGWSLDMTEAAVRAIIRRADAAEAMDSPAWDALSSDAKALFLTLTTTPHINMAGMIDWSPRRRPDTGLTDAAAADPLHELDRAGLIVFDDETEEVFVPSKVQFTIKALDDYFTGASLRIRAAFNDTLRAKYAEHPDLKLWGHKRARHVIDLHKLTGSRA